MNCPNCQTPYEGDSRFCAVCGTERPAEAPQAAPVAEVQAPVYEAAPEAAAKTPVDVKKIAIVGGIAVAVIVVLLLIVGLFSNNAHYQMYTIDGEVMLVDTNNGETASLSDDTVYNAVLTKDGKRMFYTTNDGSGADLYYCNPAKPDEDATKVASKIAGFAVTMDGKQGVYTKASLTGLDLYRTNMKDSEKIAKKVSSFRLSADGKWLIYTTTDNNLYIQKKGKDAEKVASKVSDYTVAADDYDTIVYTNSENKLYVYDGKESNKVASDVSGFYAVTKKANFYYVTVKESKSTLYFYDGKEGVKVSDKYSSFLTYNTEDNKTPRLVFTEVKDNKSKAYVVVGGNEPVELGENVSSAEFNEKGDMLAYSTSKMGDTKTSVTLSEVKVKKDSLGEAEEIVSESYKNEESKYLDFGYLPDGKTLYYVYDKDFVVKGETVATDVNSIYADISVDLKTMLISTDYKAAAKEGEESTFTLWKYKVGAKKADKIADDVTDAAFDGSNNILYIKDEALYKGDKKIVNDADGVGGMTYLAMYKEYNWAFQTSDNY